MVRIGDVREFITVRNQWRGVDQLELAVGYVGVGEHRLVVFNILLSCIINIALICSNICDIYEQCNMLILYRPTVTIIIFFTISTNPLHAIRTKCLFI